MGLIVSRVLLSFRVQGLVVAAAVSRCPHPISPRPSPTPSPRPLVLLLVLALVLLLVLAP